MSGFDMPSGFRAALAVNPDALRKFASLSDRQKWEVVSGTHAVDSKKDMKKYVDNFLKAY